MADAPKQDEFVSVKTTLPTRPFPANQDRSPIITERLVLRPVVAEDLDSLHVLRTQPEVMLWTMTGKIDLDMSETQERLDAYLPPNDVDTYSWAICLLDTGEFIGIGGLVRWVSSLGWPEVGYMIRREHWGKGFVSECMKAFLAEWDELPRSVVEVKVDARTATAVGSDGLVEEQLIAVTDESNGRSQGVLRKCGFEHLVTWKARHAHFEDGRLVLLPTYRHFPGRKAV